MKPNFDTHRVGTTYLVVIEDAIPSVPIYVNDHNAMGKISRWNVGTFI